MSCVRKRRNLFLGGGGVKTLSFLGSLEIIGTNHWEVITGVSAGSIIALLLVLGYKPQDSLYTFLEHEHVLLDSLSLERICHGDPPGDPQIVRGIVTSLLARKGFGVDTSFSKLRARRCTRLEIMAFCIETQKIVTFSSDNCPHLPIWEAIAASIAIPVIFPPMRTTCNPSLSYYDAGLISSSPLEFFDAGNTFAIIVRLPVADSGGMFPETIIQFRCTFRVHLAVEDALSRGMMILQVPPLANGMTLLCRGKNTPCVCMNMGKISFVLYALRAEMIGLLALMLCSRCYYGQSRATGHKP